VKMAKIRLFAIMDLIHRQVSKLVMSVRQAFIHPIIEQHASLAQL
jgi:hypothetical protein